MRRKILGRHGLSALLILGMCLALLALAGCAGNSTGPGSPPANAPANEAGAPQSAPPGSKFSRFDLVFAVAGDSRSDVSWVSTVAHDPVTDTTAYASYIDTPAVSLLNENIIGTWGGSPGFFFAHLGDFGKRGGTPVFDMFTRSLAPWQAAGIPVYPAVGNHELRYYGPKKETGKKDSAETYEMTLLAQAQYQAAFTQPWLMPADASFLTDYRGLAYHFKRGSTAFIVMDAYYASTTSKMYKKGYYSDVQLKWLQDTLIAYKNDPSVKHRFVLSHQPVFDAYGGAGRLYEKYDKNPPKGRPTGASARSGWILWALLDKYKVDTFFCGHSHFYHRWNVVGPAYRHKFGGDWAGLGSEFDPSGIKTRHVDAVRSWETTIPQVLNGAAGAWPMEDLAETNKVPAEAAAKVHNFSIVFVQGGTVTVEVYSFGDRDWPNGEQPTGSWWAPKLIDKFRGQNNVWKKLPLTPEPA